MGCWNSNTGGTKPVNDERGILNKQWESELNKNKPSTPAGLSSTVLDPRRSSFDESPNIGEKDHTADTHLIKNRKASMSLEEEKETKGIRIRRIMTEKQVAMIAKANPEMLDLKAKEIISSLNNRNLRRNNQLQSLGGNFGSVNHRSMENKFDLDVKPINEEKGPTNFGDTPRLVPSSIDNLAAEQGNVSGPKNNLPLETPRSFESKTSSLNRARIITNINEINDDIPEHELENPLATDKNYEKKKTQAHARKQELEDLLKEIDDDSDDLKIENKPKKYPTEVSETHQSSNIMTTKFTQPYLQNNEEVEAKEFNLQTPAQDEEFNAKIEESPLKSSSPRDWNSPQVVLDKNDQSFLDAPIEPKEEVGNLEWDF
ncbi:unnamed protein product [Moneuplotes crassus]|uniref:Uncharacterized protein n=2 Tax=Euplotes crassus TaxID=5936 RepID=A0AAD1UHV9_EUPCR|nr:unnamed protein product [Moneuplotes crassus]